MVNTTSGRIQFTEKEEFQAPTSQTPQSSSGRINFDPTVKESFKSKYGIDQQNGGVNLEQLKSKYSSQPGVPKEEKPKKGFLSGLASFGTGFAKGAVSTIEGMSSLGERMIQGTLKTVLPESAEKRLGLDKELEVTSAEKVIPEKYRTVDEGASGAEKAGFITEQIAEFFIPGTVSTKVGKAASMSKYLNSAPKWVKSLVPLVARSVTEAGIVGGQTALQQGEIGADAKSSAIAGAAFPVGGAALSKVGGVVQKIAPKAASRLINSIIKTKVGEFAYGKNPGLQVAKEGIVANSMEDLITKISQKKSEVGNLIGNAIKPFVNKVVSATNIIKPIDDALNKLSKAPRTNASAISRLQAVKDDILGMVDDLDSITVDKLNELKMDIGELAKWTGNASDDKVINMAIQNSYRAARDIVESNVPTIAKLNERWGNLLAAEKAARHRADILNSRDLIGLGEKILGTGAGATAGFLFGDTQGAVLGGVGAAGVGKLMATPAFRTRLASLLAKGTDKEKRELLRRLPGIRDVMNRIFGEKEVERLLPSALPKGKAVTPSAKKGEVAVSPESKGFIQSLIDETRDLFGVGKGVAIKNPNKKVTAGIIDENIANILGTNIKEVKVSRQTLKHIAEKDREELIRDLPEIISSPSKIADNRVKRPNSFILAKMYDDKAKGVVLEIKISDKNQPEIITSMFIDKSTYKKIKDISGRADGPPLP